jgi:nucleoside 2-deoxyribosyltransferase
MHDYRNYDVFISHAHGDEPWASKFVDELEAQGVRAWLNMADIGWGERWIDKTEQVLREAPIIVVLLSPDYMNDPSAVFELGAALGGNKKIIPIMTQKAEHTPVPLFLRDRQWLQETSPQAAGKRVAEVVEHLSNQNAARAD